jgi:AcrR family transcriptional regulator
VAAAAAAKGRRGRPSSRERILDAAYDIVAAEGAGRLTFDALSARTGISRGGILYNFPSKDELLQAMIRQHMDRCRELEAEIRASLPPGPGAAIRAMIGAWHAGPKVDHKAAASLLAAVAESPRLLDPVREVHGAQAAAIRADGGDAALAFIAWLALDGLFFHDLFSLSPLDAAEKDAVVARIRALVGDAG